VVAARGDRYILRRPSPGETLGGGAIVDPHPKGRHRRFVAETLQALEALAQGDPADVLLQTLLALGAASLKEVVERSSLDAARAAEATHALLAGGQMLVLEGRAEDPAPDDLVVALGVWEAVRRKALGETTAYHRANPLRKGIPREELKSRLKDAARRSPRLANAALRRLAADGELVEAGPLTRLPEHQVRFSAAQQQGVDRLMKRFAASPYSPPTLKECQAEVGDDVTAALVDLGELVSVAPDVVFRRQDYDGMLADVRRLIAANGALTVAQARDHFNTSRRYVLAFLEHLDAIGVTTRQGDERRLR
jgi:selenocysteine-specific elongation factor